MQSVASAADQPFCNSAQFLHTREEVACVMRDKINAAISEENITEVSSSFGHDASHVIKDNIEELHILCFSNAQLTTTIITFFKKISPCLVQGVEIWQAVSEALFISRRTDENLSVSV